MGEKVPFDDLPIRFSVNKTGRSQDEFIELNKDYEALSRRLSELHDAGGRYRDLVLWFYTRCQEHQLFLHISGRPVDTGPRYGLFSYSYTSPSRRTEPSLMGLSFQIPRGFSEYAHAYLLGFFAKAITDLVQIDLEMRLTGKPLPDISQFSGEEFSTRPISVKYIPSITVGTDQPDHTDRQDDMIE